MLGRRAALGTSIAALAIAGGGGAIAATHDSSHVTKPQVHKVVRHHAVVKKAVVQKAQMRSGHHCSHMGNVASSL
jgi:glutamine cyclotransferase